MNPPDYFAPICDKARSRWDQLEQDPELAGPWHQLFKQVQSPRHVVSELLQNADDAGATRACVQLEGRDFVFRHNGGDFVAEHFQSLCRFGYSNKRNLHTIGFRGIGFKSTFSLGDEVRLRTGTLSVAFQRSRFTEPRWVPASPIDGTEIRVQIRDENHRAEIEKNLDDWLSSPASLLFFQTIRSLKVGETKVEWVPDGAGPVARSQWMKLKDDRETRFLLLRSPDASIPDEAVEEIRLERMVSAEDETPLPDCRVEIVLGMEGRLYVVLPTGVKTHLPFACNGPFIQDPARMKIKDPIGSPTNRWLLQLAGQTASEAMLEWLGNTALRLEDRGGAYGLMPNIEEHSQTIEGASASIVQNAFARTLDDQAVLLTEEGKVVPAGACVGAPREILRVWSPTQVSQLFDGAARPLLCTKISAIDRAKLTEWGLSEEIEKSSVLDKLESRHLPRPDSWGGLLALWSYVSSDVRAESYLARDRTKIRILPVQGKNVLYGANEVVRFGEKRLLQRDEDWEFLSKYLLVVNQNWPRFLAEQRRQADESMDDRLRNDWLAATGLLNKLGLDGASDPGKVIEQVASSLPKDPDYSTKDDVRLAQIAAKLGAKVGGSFHFVTRDGTCRAGGHPVIADVHGTFDDFVDEQWYEEHVLSEEYYNGFISCSHSDWEDWITSGKSGLQTFIPLTETSKWFSGRKEAAKLLSERGVDGGPYYPYVTSQFVLKDIDFDPQHWIHWEELSDEDPTIWQRLMEQVFLQPSTYWTKALNAGVYQIATTGTQQSISGTLSSNWIRRLRSLPCLLDNRGQLRQPGELLRRTPETEALLDVEPFVRAEDDTERNRPLLIALGVGDTPTGPDRLLERLRNFSGHEDPPIFEIEKWCTRLDQLLNKCSTDEAEAIRAAFSEERLLFTTSGEWVTSREAFLNTANEEVPDAAIVHPALRRLAIWSKIGVADRPTAELALGWLDRLEPDQKLTADELRRVKPLLPRFAQRIWTECGHWLNLEGQWAPVDKFRYCLTMQSLTGHKHLFGRIRQATADFQLLDSDTCQQPPFNLLPTLASKLTEEFEESVDELAEAEPRPWLRSLGQGIARIELEDEAKQASLRELGLRLANTHWQVANGLESVPYIDGVPAGTSRPVDAVWRDTRLFVIDRPVAQLFRSIARELASAFDSADVGAAIHACIDRSDRFIEDYLDENFTLSSQLPTATTQTDSGSTSEAQCSAQPIDREHSTESPSSTAECNGDEQVERGDTSDDVDPVIELAGSAGSDDADSLDEYLSVRIEGGTAEVDAVESPSGLNGETLAPTAAAPDPPKAAKPKLISLFASEQGYAKDGTDRYYRDDGGSLQKSPGAVFAWDEYAVGGQLIQSYWPKESCLFKDSLDLPAEVWNLCDRYPEKYSLLLRNLDDSVHVLAGVELKRLHAEGHVTLHPANYRLVHCDTEN
ncbi:sacsin N-terminal ATP-binding-like domain-containing protein [Botrimarina mediterranea]|uniref:ATPase n=1 Tax=Botrimarina mediterranea TaxID=2528022 RepID=A0A518K7M8_9BACT|nr:ATPase [Botrimarina mediterranea]QDV73808.1 hypothetical protein Spa11_20070 [Botrimarina mediterranea]